MIKLNKSYFILFLFFITILQYLLYEKTLKLDKLNKGVFYITSLSKESTTSFKINGYGNSFSKLQRKSKGLFNEVYHLNVTKDSKFKFLDNFTLLESNSKLNGLSKDNLKHKNIYDSCNKPEKIISMFF